MKIGIAGSINGIMVKQADGFLTLMARYRQKYGRLHFHHGGCIGADESIHNIIKENALAENVHIHPPSDSSLMSGVFKTAGSGDSGKIQFTVHKERPHLGRYYEIIDKCDVIVALPEEDKEIKDSDVWAAVRYAKTKKKNIITVFPDGRATKWPAVKAAGKG